MEKEALMSQLNAQMGQGPKKSALSRIAGGRRGTFYSNLAQNPTNAKPAATPVAGTTKSGSRVFTALRNTFLSISFLTKPKITLFQFNIRKKKLQKEDNMKDHK